jgi:hypothetical protein
MIIIMMVCSIKEGMWGGNQLEEGREKERMLGVKRIKVYYIYMYIYEEYVYI